MWDAGGILGIARDQDGQGSVRTMVFTPDFSLLFCLTHSALVNFSHP